jgi:hypothetical protein
MQLLEAPYSSQSIAMGAFSCLYRRTLARQGMHVRGNSIDTARMLAKVNRSKP